MSLWLPSTVLSLFVAASVGVRELPDIVASVSIAALGYIALMQQVKAEIPRIKRESIAGKVILINLLYSFVPLFYFWVMELRVKNRPDLEPNPALVSFLVYLLFSLIIWPYTIYKLCKQWPLLGMEVPEQERRAGFQGGLDRTWRRIREAPAPAPALGN